MQKKAFLYFVSFLALIFLAAILLSNFSNSKNNLEVTIRHSSKIDDPKFYNEAFSLGEKYLKVEKNKVYGGIIPHHLLASPLIAAFFEGIKDQKVKTVILISPNHYNFGENNISTSKAKFSTLYGDLEPDSAKISLLEQKRIAVVNEELFENEHGIFGLTPFIKAIFPDSKLIPITIKGGTSIEECDKLAVELNKIADKDTIIIVSTDFSHYLTSAEADIHDKQSLPAIKSFNLEKVFHLHFTKNTDSPESLYTLLKIMKLKNAVKPELLANTNSAKLTNKPGSQSTTSYVTMYFSE